MDRFRFKHTQASSCTQCESSVVFRAAHSVAEPSLWRGMSSSSASYAIGDGSARFTLPAAPTPAGIDGAIAEEDEGEDASPAK